MRPSSENVFSSKGSPTSLIPASSSVGSNSSVFSSAIASSIASSRSGVSSRSPGGGGEDEVEHAALLGRELGLDQVGRLLRVGARDLELVLEAAADRGDEQDQAGDDPDPGEDDPPRVGGAPAVPARERAGRETLVGCPSVRLDLALVLGHAPPLPDVAAYAIENAGRGTRGGVSSQASEL